MSLSATLRTMCIQKTTELLLNRVWDRGEGNPFSYMPSSVVDELLSFPLPVQSRRRRANPTHLRLLLTSGRLEHVVLPRAESAKDCVRLLQMLSRGCQNVRTLSILWGLEVQSNVDVERAHQELLRKCTKLENLHSSIYLHPNDLMKCNNLKSLRLHFDGEIAGIFSRCISSDLLKRLGSLEVLSLCPRIYSSSRKDHVLHLTCTVLDNCPQLTSLEYMDSSEALNEFYCKDQFQSPRGFQMRKCYWAAGKGIAYCDRIRVAALSCPLMEVLVISVYDAGVLQHLKTLMKLTSLAIDFQTLQNDHLKEFYNLLDKIGPQLRHLSVSAYGCKYLNLNLICSNCPNLRTLQLKCRTTVDDGVQPCLSLLHLERLSVCKRTGDYSLFSSPPLESNRHSIFFLLSNCLHLKVLCMDNCQALEDGALLDILRKNSFAELEVALIDGCSLSETGCREFVQRASKLSTCCLQSGLLDNYEVMRCVKNLNPDVKCQHPRNFFGLRKEHFLLSSDPCCWL